MAADKKRIIELELKKCMEELERVGGVSLGKILEHGTGPTPAYFVDGDGDIPDLNALLQIQLYSGLSCDPKGQVLELPWRALEFCLAPKGHSSFSSYSSLTQLLYLIILYTLPRLANRRNKQRTYGEQNEL